MTESGGSDPQAVRALAEALGVAINPDHLAEVAQAWAMMAPHRALITAAPLGPQDEPAGVFRP